MNELLDFVLHEKITIISPHAPFKWASGAIMPIYNDNRVLISSQKGRTLIVHALKKCVHEMVDTYSHTTPSWDYVAGVATAGIAPGILLAMALETQFIYVRTNEKKHGLQRKIEGLSPHIWHNNTSTPLAGKKILVVEDVLSTGTNAAQAVRILQTHGATLTCCLSIFTYGFDAVHTSFSTLEHPCNIFSTITLDMLLNRAIETGKITEEDMNTIQQWKADPFNWARVHYRNTI